MAKNKLYNHKPGKHLHNENTSSYSNIVIFNKFREKQDNIYGEKVSLQLLSWCHY